MELEVVFAQGVGKFADFLLIAIAEMGRSAKNLKRSDPSARDFGEQRGSERLVDVAIRRENALHQGVPAAGETGRKMERKIAILIRFFTWK